MSSFKNPRLAEYPPGFGVTSASICDMLICPDDGSVIQLFMHFVQHGFGRRLQHLQSRLFFR
ncbi:MAG: hypothetical protein EBT93_04740 [Alphaproteobacteria bacterium]|nr:hypothetical protein [Alphaproteobacteria bacterium]